MNQKRKRPQRPVSGWVIFDKPYGMGSTDAVSFIKRTYRADKAAALQRWADWLEEVVGGSAVGVVGYLPREGVAKT